MATQTRNRVDTSISGTANQSLNLADSSTATNDRNFARRDPRGFDDGDAFGGADNNVDLAEGEIAVPQWVAESSLMRLEGKLRDSTEPICFFEPLGYCESGRLVNEFCTFHRQFMFNVDIVDTAMMTRRDQHSVIYRVSTRRLIKFPTELNLQLSTIVALPELCNNFEEYKATLNLGQFASNLQTTLKNVDKVNKIVAEHKAYLVTVLRLYTRNNEVGQIEDSKVSQCMEMWIKNASNNLNRYAYDARLLVHDNGRLMWLQLNNCSLFTQMIALLYEIPYIQAPSLNGIWLSLPAAVVPYNGGLALDCTKASHGTYHGGGGGNRPPAYGDPATIAMFRSDNQESMLFVSETYTPNRKICFNTKIDTKMLLGRNLNSAGGLALLDNEGELNNDQLEDTVNG